MRRVLAACAVVATGCARNPPPIAAPVLGSIAFTAQTAANPMVEGSFAGTAVIHDGNIDVVLSSATLSFPSGETERWRSVTLRAFVAADYRRGDWKAPVESRPTNLWRYMTFPTRSLSDTRTSLSIKDTLHFVAPIPPGASLATARLAVEIEWVTLYKDYGETESNIAFSRAPLTVRPPAP